MQRVFLVAVPIAGAANSVTFLEMIFVDDVPVVVFDWISIKARRPRTTLKLDPQFLKPAAGKADYVYKAIIHYPRTMSSSET